MRLLNRVMIKLGLKFKPFRSENVPRDVRFKADEVTEDIYHKKMDASYKGLTDGSISARDHRIARCKIFIEYEMMKAATGEQDMKRTHYGIAYWKKEIEKTKKEYLE